MKKLYEKQKNSIPYLGKMLKINNEILYKYTSKKHNVDNMTIKLMYNIAKIENISVESLYLQMKEYLEK